MIRAFKKIFKHCKEDFTYPAFYWLFYCPNKEITVKDVIDITLQHEKYCSFMVNDTECEWYRGNCWVRLNNKYEVRSNEIGRNDIEQFYDEQVLKIKIVDEWGYRIYIDLKPKN